ncbi:MAG: leucine-rich repeat protein [Oscillospiraceae bacterium]
MKIKKIIAGIMALNIMCSFVYAENNNIFSELVNIVFADEEVLTYDENLSYKIITDEYGIQTITITGCAKNAKEVEIPSEIDGITVNSLGDKAFYQCSSLKSVKLPDSLRNIGNYCFAECTSLTEINFPDFMENISSNAFNGCTSLEDIDISEDIYIIEEYAFFNCESMKEIIIPRTVIEIHEMAIGYNSSGEIADDFVIKGYSGTAAEQYAVDNGIEFIDLNNTNQCGKNSEYSFDEETGVLTISGYGETFENFSLITIFDDIREKIKEVVIEDGITSIGCSMFTECTEMEKAIIPESVVSISRSAFADCTKLSDAEILSDNLEYIAEDAFANTAWYENYPDDLIYIGDMLYKYKGGSGNRVIEIKDGTKRINWSAFKNSKDIDKIIVPDSIENIDSMAFYRSKVKEIVLPESIKSIESYAFAFCNMLEKINLPEGLLKIEDEAFRGCTMLEEINLPESITEIGDNAFYNCENLKEINLPEGVTTIGSGAFDYCKNLREIYMPDSVTRGGSFDECEKLEKIRISENLEYLPTFRGCSLLKSIDIPDNVSIIVGLSGSGLEEIIIPDSVTEIVEQAFMDCTNLKKAVLPKDIKTIEQWTFKGCSSLTDIIIPESVETIGFSAFRDCASLKEITIPANVKEIDDRAFGFYYVENMNQMKKYTDFVIKGYAGTAAEQYAIDNGFEFIDLSNIQGDINGDGQITSSDALNILQAVTDIVILTDEQKKTADINGDGEITSADALAVLQIVVSME